MRGGEITQHIHRGLYRRIPRLAKIIGVSPVDVVAAAKITGNTVVPGMIFFPVTITPEFVEEAWLSHDMRQAAAARRQALETQTLNQNPPGPPSDRRPQAA